MSAFRTSLRARYGSYVCPSCVVRLERFGRPSLPARYWASTASPSKENERTSKNRTTQRQDVSDSEVTVKHFDSTPDGRVEPAEDELGEDTLSELKARVAALEADLRAFKTKTSNVESGALIDQEPLQRPNIQKFRIPLEQFEDDRRKSITKLNQALQNYARQPSSTANILYLWKWYARSRNNLSSAWHLVPKEVWTLLWDAFSSATADNIHLRVHIKTLGADITKAGVELARPQTLLYIESIFLEGSQDEAIGLWEKQQDSLVGAESTARGYWALGARMFVLDGQYDRAEHIMDILVNVSKPGQHPEVLIPVIRSILATGDVTAPQRSFAVYVRLRHIAREHLKMADYDGIAGAFLSAQHTDLALAVFRDMMLSGETKPQEVDTLALYRRTFPVIQNIRSFKINPAELEWKSSDTFSRLPRSKENKFFYGSWIKKLIGAGQVDWAAQVAAHMSRRGVAPDPKFVNGIVGAWLRSGTPSNQKKAEDLAWKMISTRIENVRKRDQYRLQKPLRILSRPGKEAFERPSTFLHVPTPATLETFCVLMNYYQQRRRGDRAQDIVAAIKAAKIRPNAEFLNDLLLVAAMQDRKMWAWNAYNQLVNAEGVLPDLDTFSVLWQMMNDRLQKPTTIEFPTPRQLFAELPKWVSRTCKGTLSKELYNLITHCFIMADDYIGAITAVRALDRRFDMAPDENSVRTIVLDLAQAGYRQVSNQLPRRQERNKDLQNRISRLTEFLKAYHGERTQPHEHTVDDDESKQTSEVVGIVEDLILFAVRSGIVDSHLLRTSDTEIVRELITAAAADMGVAEALFE